MQNSFKTGEYDNECYKSKLESQRISPAGLEIQNGIILTYGHYSIFTYQFAIALKNNEARFTW